MRPGISNSIEVYSAAAAFSDSIAASWPQAAYISRPRLADVCRNAAGLEQLLKAVNALRRRRIVIKLLRSVVRYQVDLYAGKLIGVEQPHQSLGVSVTVVYAAEHHILERESFTSSERALKFLRRGHQFVEVPSFIDGHKLVPKFVLR